MIISCIQSVFGKSGVSCGLIKSVRTIFGTPFNHSRLLSRGNLESHLLMKNPVWISHVTKVYFSSEPKSIQIEQTAIKALKKRPKKKRLVSSAGDTAQPGFWNVKALATAEEYNLEALMEGLLAQDLYEPKEINTSSKSVPDVIHVVPKYEVGHEAREMYFFREGTVIMWNISDLESGNLLQFLKNFEENHYPTTLVQAESEIMTYSYAELGRRSHLKDGAIYLASNSTNLDKYTFSNAISQSVKLGIWEASLDNYIDSIEFVTEDLKAGRKIKMSREEVLRKQGELFALRHHINLSSDLLDTPDFYWEQEDLEQLYQQTCGYFSIAKRTRVMNEKINHCVELVELLSSHLSDRHHVRLEWMIIILILVEVGFELVHYVDRYLEKQESAEANNHE